MPPSSRGQPSSPVTGGWMTLNSWRKPVHQITLATSSTVPSSSRGRPSTAPVVRLSTRWTPAASRSARLTRSSGVPSVRITGCSLRPMGVRVVRTWLATTRGSETSGGRAWCPA